MTSGTTSVSGVTGKVAMWGVPAYQRQSLSCLPSVRRRAARLMRLRGEPGENLKT